MTGDRNRPRGDKRPNGAPWQRTFFVAIGAAVAFGGFAAQIIDNVLVDAVVGLGAGVIAGGLERWERLPDRALVGIIAAAVLAIVVIVIVQELTGETIRRPVVVDQRDEGVSGNPNALVADGRGAWVVTTDGGLYRVDQKLGVGDRIPLRKGLFDVAVGFGYVWATNGGRLYRVHRKAQKRDIRWEKYGASGCKDNGCEVAVSPTGVWFKDFDAGQIHLIGKGLGKAKLTIDIPAPNGMAVGLGSLWVTTGSDEEQRGKLSRFSPSGRLEDEYEIDADPQDLVVDEDNRYVLINHYGSDSVTRLSPDDGEMETASLGTTAAAGIALGLGAVWVPSEDKGDLSEILVEKLEAVDQTEIGTQPTDVAVAGNTVYVADQSGNNVRLLFTKIKDVEK